jgi:hypothetical protein
MKKLLFLLCFIPVLSFGQATRIDTELSNIKGGILSFDDKTVAKYYRLSSYGVETYVYDAYSADNFSLNATDSIITVKDGSGNGVTLSQTGTLKAKYDKANKRILFADGKFAQYGLAARMDLGSVYTEVLVYNNSNNTNGIFVAGTTTSGNYGYIGLVASAFYLNVYTNKASGYTSQTSATTQIVVITRTGNTIHYYKNGAEVTQASNTITGTESGYFMCIGRTSALGTAYDPKGYLYYYGNVKAVLTPTQATDVYNALKTRYGL